jgi:hypothetical protein
MVVKTIHAIRSRHANRKAAQEGIEHMFSKHFGEELLGQMARATGREAKHILINSHELHCSLSDFPGTNHHSTDCCEAMESEMKAGDVCVVDKSNGWGLTIRYLLPRTS